jgi:hypothetical protein
MLAITSKLIRLFVQTWTYTNQAHENFKSIGLVSLNKKSTTKNSNKPGRLREYLHTK